MEQKYKRTTRTQSQKTRKKISQSLKGRPKTWSHCLHISKGMQAYWRNDANFPDDAIPQPSGATTIQDLV